MDNGAKIIVENLKKAILESPHTKKQIAQKLGISRATLDNHLKDSEKIPLWEVCRICTILNIPLETLHTNKDDSKTIKAKELVVEINKLKKFLNSSKLDMAHVSTPEFDQDCYMLNLHNKKISESYEQYNNH